MGDEFYINLITSVFLTAAIYMAFPLIRLAINHGKFEKKRAKKIALWNSIVLGIFFFFVTAATSEEGTTWNPAPAFLYYWINCALLTDKYATDLSTVLTENDNDTAKKTEPTTSSLYTTDLMIKEKGKNQAPAGNGVYRKGFSTSARVEPQTAANSPSSETRRVLFCRKCGEKIIDNNQFCEKCGTKVIKEELP